MRAIIYTVYDQMAWTWRVSLDLSLNTDQLYWSTVSEDQRVDALFRGADELPYGQAVQLATEMNALAISGDGISAYVERYSLREVPIHRGSLTNHIDVSLLDKLDAAMKGRSLLWEEFVSILAYLGVTESSQNWKAIAQFAYLSGYVDLGLSLVTSESKTRWGWGKRTSARCSRCGHSEELIKWSECASCGVSCAYCESCLQLGKTRACAPLIKGKGINNPSDVPEHRDWTDGEQITAPYLPIEDWQLSPAQLVASEAGIRHLLRADKNMRDKPFLIWAVTGAGKTEMIFPIVATELHRSGKVLIATPRRDVVLELLPRIKTAFPNQQVIALYGGSSHRWEHGDITLATTHQLLRYEGAFDLVVIDEIDAFPYHNNPVLAYAAQKVKAPAGTVVLLSATPPEQLQMDAKKGRIAHIKVPIRYHGKPLPTPTLIRYGGIHHREGHANRGSNSRLAAIIMESIKRGAQLFIFVSAIHRLEPTLSWVRGTVSRLLRRDQIEATSSQDANRHERILRFREGTTRILLTTTILERGVTIPKSDVIVLDADSTLFDAAALVQMAGRAGRSAADPYGKVYYVSRERTRAQVQAIDQIRTMNRIARRSGYIS